MERIAVIGCPGAGKTTLSLKLGRALGVPVFHLDRIFWRPGWRSIPKDQFVQEQRKIFQEPAWIIDGNYGATMELRLHAADTILFLDLPTRVCLWGSLRRYWQYRNRSRPDLAEGNPERITGSYFWFVLCYRRLWRPKVIRRLSALGPGRRVFILKSRAEVDAFLRRVPQASACEARSTAPRPASA